MLAALMRQLRMLQRALRLQQAALAKRIAEGRSDGRTRRRLLRKERLSERMHKEREEHTQRRQMVKVWPALLPGLRRACCNVLCVTL